MNVIIATGKQEIDLMIQKATGGGLSPVAYREGVLLQFQRYGAELAFLSPLLPGDIPFEQLLYELRKHGVRVIALVGHTSPKEIKEKWLPLSVYDLILDPVTEEKIMLAIDSPATLGMAEEKISLLEKGEMEEPKTQGWLNWFGKREPVKQKVEPKISLEENKANDSKLIAGISKIQSDIQEKASSLNWLFGKRKEVAKNIESPHSAKPQILINKNDSEVVTGSFSTASKSEVEAPKQTDQNKSVNSQTLSKKLQTHIPKASLFAENEMKSKHELIFSDVSSMEAQSDKPKQIESKPKHEKPKDNKRSQEPVYNTTPSQEWNAVLGYGDGKIPEPEGYTIVVTSPSATGKTYVALNLAATLSKEGVLTKLVSFRGETALWTYLDLPTGKRGPVQEYPNLYVETFENMATDGHYRVIDLPFDGWDKVLHWDNVLVVYVEDMDIHHKKLCEKYRDFWQGKRLLRVLNRFVPNVLETGQEQRLRINADLVLNDQPVNLVAMRYGRPVIHIDQSARREFEYAVKNILEAIPRTTENVRSIG